MTHADALEWDEVVDVIVCGFGGAGACAAIEAADHGAQVLVIDRYDGGGATQASGGVYYGAGTRQQREAGFDDDADEMFKYLSMEIGDVVKPETLRRFCDGSKRNLEWLENQGLTFGSRFDPAKTSYPGKGVFLYYSGNEQSPRHAAVAKPAPRGHRVVGEGLTGKSFFAGLKQAVVARGIRVWTHSPATELVTDTAGEVIGVIVTRFRQGSSVQRRRQRINRWTSWLVGAVSAGAARWISQHIAAIEQGQGEWVRVRARRGVVLASGGYIFNRKMIANEAPLYADAAPLGTPGCDGSGILLGRSVGAATARMDTICASRSIAPPTGFVKGVLVNRDGQRIVAEDAYTCTLGRMIAESPGGIGWLILDSKLRREAVRESLPGGGRLLLIHCLPSLMLLLFGSRKAASIASLAQRCDIPRDALMKTVDAYNATIADGIADSLGKKKDYRQALQNGPFYALDISLRSKAAPLPTFSLGGLVVDEISGGMRRADGTIIKGLYAAGRAAIGLCSRYYISGLSLSDCVFSGRRAGLHAATAAED